MSPALTVAYLLVQLMTGNGVAAVTIPFQSFDACEAAMRNMGKVDAPGIDPRPMYCFDAVTGKVAVR